MFSFYFHLYEYIPPLETVMLLSNVFATYLKYGGFTGILLFDYYCSTAGYNSLCKCLLTFTTTDISVHIFGFEEKCNSLSKTQVS